MRRRTDSDRGSDRRASRRTVMRDADDPVDARARDDVRRLSKDDARAIELAIARQHDEKDVKVIARDENETTMARVEDARAAVESAVETFSTRLRNVKEAVSADASRATAMAREARRELRDLASMLDEQIAEFSARIARVEEVADAFTSRVNARGEDCVDGSIVWDSATKMRANETRAVVVKKSAPEEWSTTRRVESRAWTCARSACSLIFTVIVATMRMFWLFVVVSLSLFMMTGAASMQRSALVSSRDLEREISDRWTMYTHEILASMN